MYLQSGRSLDHSPFLTSRHQRPLFAPCLVCPSPCAGPPKVCCSSLPAFQYVRRINMYAAFQEGILRRVNMYAVCRSRQGVSGAAGRPPAASSVICIHLRSRAGRSSSSPSRFHTLIRLLTVQQRGVFSGSLGMPLAHWRVRLLGRFAGGLPLWTAQHLMFRSWSLLILPPPCFHPFPPQYLPCPHV